MLVALTGATGNLGRSVIRALHARGHRVRALLRPGSSPATAGALLAVERVWLPGTVEASAPAALAGAEVLVHLGAYGVQGRDRDWSLAVAVNTLDTIAWVRGALEAGVARTVVTGSYFEYEGRGRLPTPAWPEGTPAPPCDEDAPLEAWDPYSASKAAGGVLARAFARDQGHALWYLRLASLYGPDDDPGRFIPMTVRAAREREPLSMSPGAQVRDLVHVDDAALALCEVALRDPPEGVQTVNLGTGRGTSLFALGQAVLRLAGGAPSLLRPGTRPYRPREAHHLVCSTARRDALLAWRPRTLEEALPSVVQALLERS